MTTQTNQSISWDQFFDLAAEDASLCLWAARFWPDPPESFSKGYLLTLALASRARTRAALERIPEGLAKEMAPHAKKLESMANEADALLKAQVDLQGRALRELVNGELAARAQALESALDRVRALDEEACLFDGHDAVQNELREAAHEFVLRFQDMMHARRELEGGLFSNVDSAPLAQAMDAVEARLQSSFSAFDAIHDLFPAMQAREWGVRHWWLQAAPAAEESAELEAMENVLTALSPAYAQECQNQTLDDAEALEAAAMALDELDAEAQNAALERLSAHGPAMSFVNDARLAALAAQEAQASPRVLPALAEAMKPAPSWTESFNAIVQAVGRSLSGLTAPKLAAAAVTAGLALFIIFGMPGGVDAPGLSQPSLEIASVQPPPEGSLHVTARKDDRFLTRVSAVGPWGPDVFEMENGWSLESGDSVRINAALEQDGFASVVHVDTEGVGTALFSGLVKAGEPIALPDPDGWFMLDKNVGDETLLLISSALPIGGMENRIESLNAGADWESVFKGAKVQVFRFRHL